MTCRIMKVHWKYCCSMELHLQRTYYATGTNGILSMDDHQFCYTIELPWKENRKCISCIPEGSYRLKKRYSPRFQEHLQVMGVPGRTLILLHPANDAMNQLQGCIAPVRILIGPGRGSFSQVAFTALKQRVYPALQRNETVWLIIRAA